MNPDSAYPPSTDNGGQPPFKYPFSYARKRIEAGGWTRQVTERELPISKKMAGVEMRLISGGIRELHWHPNEDEWQYYVSGQGRMTVFTAGSHARTMDFETGEVGYIGRSQPHYIENLGNTGLVFLEVFPAPEYQDISLTEWLAHVPSRLVDQHIGTGEDFVRKLPKKEAVITPL
jgi:oxalate decarboxylase